MGPIPPCHEFLKVLNITQNNRSTVITFNITVNPRISLMYHQTIVSWVRVLLPASNPFFRGLNLLLTGSKSVKKLPVIPSNYPVTCNLASKNPSSWSVAVDLASMIAPSSPLAQPLIAHLSSSSSASPLLSNFVASPICIPLTVPYLQMRPERFNEAMVRTIPHGK